MPAPGKKWRHAIINSYASWLHGDARGFRNRGHRIHSSGDYQHPPPKSEHEGLYVHHLGASREEVHFEKSLRPVIGQTLLRYLQSTEHRTLAVAVTKGHAHLLVELPDHGAKMRAVVGQTKRSASRAVNKELPGRIWAAGRSFKPVNSQAHHRRAYRYILYEQGLGAWTWSYRDKHEDGKFGRVRPVNK